MLKRSDLLAPQRSVSTSWLCLVFRSEREDRSKTLATDESLELTCQWAPYFHRICAKLKQGDPDAPLFALTYPDILAEVRRAAATLGIEVVPYQARHSGASIDAALGYRNRSELKARGRWQSDRSVVRYESKARLAESLDVLRPPLRQHLDQCMCRLEDLLLGHVAARTLPEPR